MTARDVAKYWREGADDALATAKSLMDSKRYHHALFFYHLAIEKLLKARIVVTTNEPPPPIHELRKLAKYAQLTLTAQQEEQFKEIETFNITARYDDYKRSFYKKATKKYAETWMNFCNDIYVWLT